MLINIVFHNFLCFSLNFFLRFQFKNRFLQFWYLGIFLLCSILCLDDWLCSFPQQLRNMGPLLSDHNASITQKRLINADWAWRPYWKSPWGEKICLMTLWTYDTSWGNIAKTSLMKQVKFWPWVVVDMNHGSLKTRSSINS